MQKVSINTKGVGYKGQDKTMVSFTFHRVTEVNTLAPDLLGETVDVIHFDSFMVDGLDILASNFEREGKLPDKAENLTLSHLQGLVIRYLNGYDRNDCKHVSEVSK